MFCFKHPQILADKRCTGCSRWSCYLCSRVINGKTFCSDCAEKAPFFSFSEKKDSLSPRKISSNTNIKFQVSASLAGQGMRIPWGNAQAAKKKPCCAIHPDVEAESQCSKCGRMFCTRCLRVNDASTSICYTCWFKMPVSADDVELEDIEDDGGEEKTKLKRSKEEVELIIDEDFSEEGALKEKFGEKKAICEDRVEKEKKQARPEEYEYEFEEDELEDREKLFRIKTAYKRKEMPRKFKKSANWLANLNLKNEEETEKGENSVTLKSDKNEKIDHEEGLFSNLKLEKEEEIKPETEVIFTALKPDMEAKPPQEGIFSNLNLEKEDAVKPEEKVAFTPLKPETKVKPLQKEDFSNLKLEKDEDITFNSLKPDMELPAREGIFSNLKLEKDEDIEAGESIISLKSPVKEELEKKQDLISKEMENKGFGRNYPPGEDINKKFDDFLKAIDSSSEEYIKEIAHSIYKNDKNSEGLNKKGDTPYEEFFEKIASDIYGKNLKAKTIDKDDTESPYEKFLKRKSGKYKKNIKVERNNSEYKNFLHLLETESNTAIRGDTPGYPDDKEEKFIKLLKNENISSEEKIKITGDISHMEGENLTGYIAEFVIREDTDISIRIKALELLALRKDNIALAYLLRGIKTEKNSELRKLLAQTYSKIKYCT